MTVLAYIDSGDGAQTDSTLDTADKVGYTVTFATAIKATTTDVVLQLKKEGTPTGYVKAALSYEFEAETFIVESQNLDVSTLTGSYTDQTFTWATATTLYPNTVYTLTLYLVAGSTVTNPNLVKANGADALTLYLAQNHTAADVWNNINARLLFTLNGTAATDTETSIDYLCQVNTSTRAFVYATASIALDRNHPTADNTPHRSAVYQTFTNQSYITKLTKAAFMIANVTLTGNGPLKAKVYAVSGTGDTDAIPDGAALATSDETTPTRNGIYSTVIFTFSGANQINLSADTEYALTVEAQSGFDDTHGTSVYGTNVNLFLDENWGRYFNSAWGYVAGGDAFFAVYGVPLTLTISSVSNGSTYPAAGVTYYTAETDVVVYAKPDRGYILDSWTYDTVEQTSKDNRVTVTVTTDTTHTLTPAFTAEYTASNNTILADIKLHLGKSLGVTDFNVTLHALSLGSQDSDTGIPAKTYTDSTIEMLIVTKQDQNVATQVGRYVTLDALGFTDSYVRAWDKVTTATGKRYFITKATPYLDGSGAIVFYQAELTEEVMQ